MKSLILLVEGDPDISIVLRDRLESLGHEVVSVTDGQAAVDTLEGGQLNPGLLLLDLELPKLGGMEVLRRVRKDWPDIPVVILGIMAQKCCTKL